MVDVACVVAELWAIKWRKWAKIDKCAPGGPPDCWIWTKYISVDSAGSNESFGGAFVPIGQAVPEIWPENT